MMAPEAGSTLHPPKANPAHRKLYGFLDQIIAAQENTDIVNLNKWSGQDTFTRKLVSAQRRYKI